MRLFLDAHNVIKGVSNDPSCNEGVEYNGELPDHWQDFKYENGVIIPRVEPLQEVKRNAISLVHTAQSNFLVAYKEQYPAIEVDSFDSKRKEAEAWVLDNATPTPTIDRLVNPPETKQDLVNAILAKVAVLGEIERQTTAYRTAVKICSTPEEVAAVPLPGFITASQGAG